MSGIGGEVRNNEANILFGRQSLPNLGIRIGIGHDEATLSSFRDPLSYQPKYTSTTEYNPMSTSNNTDVDFGDSQGRPASIDLETLWKFITDMDMRARQKGDFRGLGLDDVAGKEGETDEKTSGGMTTWELVVMQAVLLSVLVFISIVWGFCCKKRCGSDEPLITEMVALARKISGSSAKDLPPSYSKVDLTQVGLTIDDHFNPPPTYDKAATLKNLEQQLHKGNEDDIVVLEEEICTAEPSGSRASSRGRFFRGVQRQVSRFSMSSIASATNQDQIVSFENEVHARKMGRFFVTRPSAEEVRKMSGESNSSADDSRKSSRVHFSPRLVEGPTSKKESTQSLPLVSVLVKNCPENRRRSTQSEGAGSDSRKVSFADGGPCRSVSSSLPSTIVENVKMLQEVTETGAKNVDDFVASSRNLNTDRNNNEKPLMI